jgi:Lon protease-like protein
LDDATWVGNRLCEVLPISLVAKQKLMELTDAPTRLSIVHQYLVQQKII